MDFTTEAEFSGEQREIAASSGGLPLTVHHPLNGASRGTVVLVPGWSGPRSGPAEILVFLAARLSRAGYTAVRVDLPGRGDAAGGQGCDLDAMIAAAAEALRERRAGPACFVGMCSGGNGALGAAAALPETCAVAALSTLPFQPARTQSFDRQRRWKNLKQYAAKALSPRNWLRLVRGDINLERVKKNVTASEKPAGGGRNLKDSARDIERELLRWRAPALFVWGGGDEEAALARAHFEKLHAGGMAAPGAARFHTIAGANHNFYGRAWREELARTILEFVASLSARG